MHSISWTVEGNDARAVMWEGYQLECNRSLYGHTIVMAQNCSWKMSSQVIDILSHSLGPLSSALSAADWLFQNTKEGTPVSAITTLSEAFGIVGFTISISWSWILKQWREFNKGSAMAFLVDEWVTPDVENRHQGKILHATVYYKRYWVYNMKKQKQEDRHSILPMLVNMATRLWPFVQMTQIFL